MSKRRERGDGTISQRGENSWRLRYRIDGRRYSVTYRGTLSDARKKLRDLLHAADTKTHVAPDKMRLSEWLDRWLAVKQSRIGRRAYERYEGLLRNHLIPTLGNRLLQQLRADEIDALYLTLAPATAVFLHAVLKPCLAAAKRKRLIAANPMDEVERPHAGEADHGRVLDPAELAKLLDGFKGTSLFAIVAVAALTGARRGEILALKWIDFDADKRTLRIERALEKAAGRVTFKPPKTKRGYRTITIDPELVAILSAERQKYLRLVAGVPDGADADLSLIRLPKDALIFPALNTSGEIDFTQPCDPHTVTLGFLSRADRLGFSDLRFHDLRGSHETALLDAGVPIHVVAARCGHDPAVLLRSYAKRTRKADESAAEVIGGLARGILGPKLGPNQL
jgi:integrase